MVLFIASVSPVWAEDPNDLLKGVIPGDYKILGTTPPIDNELGAEIRYYLFPPANAPQLYNPGFIVGNGPVTFQDQMRLSEKIKANLVSDLTHMVRQYFWGVGVAVDEKSREADKSYINTATVHASRNFQRVSMIYLSLIGPDQVPKNGLLMIGAVDKIPNETLDKYIADSESSGWFKREEDTDANVNFKETEKIFDTVKNIFENDGQFIEEFERKYLFGE
jgi:hypothetical protein